VTAPTEAGAGRVAFGISMLSWALNEEENVADFLARAEAFLTASATDFELVFIDDGSTDRTWDIVSGYQASRPWLRLYRNDRNRGSGYSAKRAIGLAAKDYLFWQTVDWSYDLTVLGPSLHLLKQYDILQGVRVNALSPVTLFRTRSDTPTKAFISIANYLLIRVLFGLPLHDYQNVTVYPRRLIQGIEIESESAFTSPECLLKVWWTGATIKEVPVTFRKRVRGQAKGTRPRALYVAIRDIVAFWLRRVVFGRRTERRRGAVVRWAERAG
jgi:glycosyltransferase involved in cell wall biosynthesis